MIILNIFAGILLLGWGRNLFWLLVAWLGFTAGFTFAAQLLGSPSDMLVLLISVGLGIMGAMFALFLESMAIGIAGFLGGAYVVGQLAALFAPQYVMPLTIAGALLGMVLMYALFDSALILVSSLVGASILLEVVSLGSARELLLLILLTLGGLFLQTRSSRLPNHRDAHPRTA